MVFQNCDIFPINVNAFFTLSIYFSVCLFEFRLPSDHIVHILYFIRSNNTPTKYPFRNDCECAFFLHLLTFDSMLFDSEFNLFDKFCFYYGLCCCCCCVFVLLMVKFYYYCCRHHKYKIDMTRVCISMRETKQKYQTIFSFSYFFPLLSLNQQSEQVFMNIWFYYGQNIDGNCSKIKQHHYYMYSNAIYNFTIFELRVFSFFIFIPITIKLELIKQIQYQINTVLQFKPIIIILIWLF